MVYRADLQLYILEQTSFFLLPV